MQLDKNVYTVPEMRRIRRIHMIGVGGTGMSGIAEVLVNLGYEVAGSDLQASAVTRRLQNRGIEIFVGHAADNIGAADVVVVPSRAEGLGLVAIEALAAGKAAGVRPSCRQGFSARRSMRRLHRRARAYR